MPSGLTPSNAAVGTDPLGHMWFEINAPERILALRMALSRVIRPGAVVLDAGCGALGVLSILAARLGAGRVVGVDFGDLDVARSLAEANGVADRINFVQGDLHDVRLPIDRFDVIVGMVYNNDIRLDLRQHRLMAGLLARYGHAGTRAVPDRVRYSAAAYDPRVADPTGASNRLEWSRAIGVAEGYTGISYAPVLRGLERRERLRRAPTSKAFRARWPRWWQRPFRKAVHGRVPRYFDRTRMKLLTDQRPFTEIEIAHGSRRVVYPASISLPVVQSGRLELVVWQQDLLFGDLLIRSSESPSLVDAPEHVKAGDSATLSTTAMDTAAVLSLSIQRPAPGGRTGAVPAVAEPDRPTLHRRNKSSA